LSYNVRYEDVGLKDYKEVWDYQASLFSELLEKKKSVNTDAGDAHGTLIFVEHPHVYTLGKSGSEDNLLLDYIQLRARDAKFYRIDRGGDITYHGPGQIVGYPIFDLSKLNIGLKEYIYLLEEAIIRSIKDFGLKGERLKGGTGVWLDPEIKGRARKICAIGVKASRYVTMHGFAFNVNTDLTYFDHINPCGFTDKGVTSLGRELGRRVEMKDAGTKVREKLGEVFDLNWIN
jgi:lipoyl(octanoyl) transferase